MKTILKDSVLIVVPETPEDEVTLSAWRAGRSGEVFRVNEDGGTGVALSRLGPEAEVCRAPINITSQIKDAALQFVGNFAATPFELDGLSYGSIEGFWQGLKFETAAERVALASMPAGEARGRGAKQGYPAVIRYFGSEVIPGTFDHWALMRRACRAKFSQHTEARDALLSTGTRPLTHKVRNDSRTIPGVIMASIWMELRDNAPAGLALPFVGGAIDRFDETYRWLSNFWPAPVTFEGVRYPTVEHAYQAAKTLDQTERKAMLACATPGDAKRLADKVTRRADWNDVKLAVMESLLRQKFRDAALRRRLVETSPLEIVEGNYWDDTFRGVCNGKGENNLGKLLMQIRAEAGRK